MDESLSPAYAAQWNDEEQARIDADIDAYRKTDAAPALNIPAGTPVRVEQTKHAFRFGAHLFNFNQLGSHEANERYKSLWDTLFNSATVAFYWRPFEPVEGRMRFEESDRDTETWWNACPDPTMQPHWRRPPTDPAIAFCEAKGVRIHGHPLVWSNREWHYPDWLMAKLPHELLAEMLTDDRSGVSILKQPLDIVAKRLPEPFVRALYESTERRVAAIAQRYGSRVQSWDVCNESANDFERGLLTEGAAFTRSWNRSFMPGNYCRHAFALARKYLPESAWLNINDFHIRPAYRDQILDMLAKGDKIDVQGLQSHIFDPNQCLELADGDSSRACPLSSDPKSVREAFARIAVPGLRQHLSEITIPSPGSDERGERIQATLLRNLYRMWFSQPNMTGITWWNVVDDCGAPGEPSVSGLFRRDMTPKASYFELDRLVNDEWRTRLTVRADADGTVRFRGFRGTYRALWRENGIEKSKEFSLA